MKNLPDPELFSAYLDGELTAEEQAQIEHLLVVSAEARQLLEDLRTVRHTLQSLPAHKLSEDLTSRVLQEAQRRQSARSSVSPTLGSPPSWKMDQGPELVSPGPMEPPPDAETTSSLAGVPHSASRTTPSALDAVADGSFCTQEDEQKTSSQEIKTEPLKPSPKHLPSEAIPNGAGRFGNRVSWNAVFRRVLSSRGLLWSSVAVAVALGIWIFGPQPHSHLGKQTVAKRRLDAAPALERPASESPSPDRAMREEKYFALEKPASEPFSPESPAEEVPSAKDMAFRQSRPRGSSIQARSDETWFGKSAEGKESNKAESAPSAAPPTPAPAARAGQPASPERDTLLPTAPTESGKGDRTLSGGFAGQGGGAKPDSAPPLSPVPLAAGKMKSEGAGPLGFASPKKGYGAGASSAGRGLETSEGPGGVLAHGMDEERGAPAASPSRAKASPVPAEGDRLEERSAEQLAQNRVAKSQTDKIPILRKAALPQTPAATVPGLSPAELDRAMEKPAPSKGRDGTALAEKEKDILQGLPEATLVVVCDLSTQALRERAFEQILTKQQIVLEETEEGVEETSKPLDTPHAVPGALALREAPEKQAQQLPKGLQGATTEAQKPSQVEGKNAKTPTPRGDQAVAESARSGNLKAQAQSPSPGLSAESQLHFVLVEATPEQIEGTLKTMQTRPQEFLSVLVSPVPPDPKQQLYRQYLRDNRVQNVLPAEPPVPAESQARQTIPPQAGPSARLEEKPVLEKAPSQAAQQPFPTVATPTPGELGAKTQQTSQAQQARARRLRLPEHLAQQIPLPPQQMLAQSREPIQSSQAPPPPSSETAEHLGKPASPQSGQTEPSPKAAAQSWADRLGVKLPLMESRIPLARDPAAGESPPSPPAQPGAALPTPPKNVRAESEDASPPSAQKPPMSPLQGAQQAAGSVRVLFVLRPAETAP